MDEIHRLVCVRQVLYYYAMFLALPCHPSPSLDFFLTMYLEMHCSHVCPTDIWLFSVAPHCSRNTAGSYWLVLSIPFLYVSVLILVGKRIRLLRAGKQLLRKSQKGNALENTAHLLVLHSGLCRLRGSWERMRLALLGTLRWGHWLHDLHWCFGNSCTCKCLKLRPQSVCRAAYFLTLFSTWSIQLCLGTNPRTMHTAKKK